MSKQMSDSKCTSELLTPSYEGEDILGFDDEEVFFLTTEHRKRFLTKFEIGKDKIVMYGDPIKMSIASDLIKSLLLTPPDPDSSYQIAKDLPFRKDALTIIWLYLNGFDGPNGVRCPATAGMWHKNTS